MPVISHPKDKENYQLINIDKLFKNHTGFNFGNTIRDLGCSIDFNHSS